MATTTQEQVESFYRFASEELTADSTADIDELYSQARMSIATAERRMEARFIRRILADQGVICRGRSARHSDPRSCGT